MQAFRSGELRTCASARNRWREANRWRETLKAQALENEQKRGHTLVRRGGPALGRMPGRVLGRKPQYRLVKRLDQKAKFPEKPTMTHPSNILRIPMKPAGYSDLKAATHSDFKAATIPI
jgi:hypothetical protein